MIAPPTHEKSTDQYCALPLLLDLARTNIFLHDGSVSSLDNLLDPVRGDNAPHPFYLADASQRADMVEFLRGLDTNSSSKRDQAAVVCQFTDSSTLGSRMGKLTCCRGWDDLDETQTSSLAISFCCRAPLDSSALKDPTKGKVNFKAKGRHIMKAGEAKSGTKTGRGSAPSATATKCCTTSRPRTRMSSSSS